MTQPQDLAEAWETVVERLLPEDGTAGTLVGRVWLPETDDSPGGPAVVLIHDDGVYDLGAAAPTSAALVNAEDPVALVRNCANASRIGDLADIARNSIAGRHDPAKPRLLAPVDLQSVRACGVTFVRSLLERVIDERTAGDPARAEAIRRELVGEIGVDLSEVRPGSPEAAKVKERLLNQGMWSQYLEVGIGPDVEVFTKAQPMSCVGFGAEVGIHPDSVWNNPEPEVVLVVNARGEIVGATLGNDVNLRDIEGRSALLLGRAKDNNASCAVGPFLRLLDDSFTLDDIRRAGVHLVILGPDGFRLEDTSSMTEISRDILDIVGQTVNANHQYPDGLILFTGTMFTPNEDRDRPGRGFTHKVGDLVTVSSEKLGTLANTVNRSDRIAPWTFGILRLIENLGARGLL